jgi:anhydro-N-acetylmuramic acid kinase
MLANDAGKEYDKDGEMASIGKVNNSLLEELNQLDYYNQPYPKSLANDFGTDIVYPLIKKSGISINDALRTYSLHIALQIKNAIAELKNLKPQTSNADAKGQHRDIYRHDFKLLSTGGGSFNTFLIKLLKEELKELNIEVIVPDKKLVNYKEALIMALIGVLRWREEYNVMATVKGASRNSIGGALWLGQEA